MYTEFSCAKERLCTAEDAQSVTGFGGQPQSVVCPTKIMANSETQVMELPQEDC